MPTIHLFRPVYFALFAADLGLVACGSSGGQPGPVVDGGRDVSVTHARDGSAPDGGRDASAPTRDGGAVHTGDASSGDATADGGAGVDGAIGPGLVVYCQAVFNDVVLCGPPSPACIEAAYDAGLDAASARYVAECANAYSAFMSDTYAQAYAGCFPSSYYCCFIQGICGEDAGIVFAAQFEDCVASKLEDVAPDPAAEKIRADYCHTCPDMDGGLHTCAGFFSFVEAGIQDAMVPDAWAAAGTGFGFGSFVREWPDSIVKQVDEVCTGAALTKVDAGGPLGGCYGDFTACAQRVLNTIPKPHDTLPDAQVPAACMPDGG